MSLRPCPLCGKLTRRATLAEASWYPPEVLSRLARAHAQWRTPGGACPACVHEALLEALAERGADARLADGVQVAWPLDPEAAFGITPTPLRMRADPAFRGRGVTIALVDSAFHPHPDLVRPVNAIRAWVDASVHPPLLHRFRPGDRPEWPGHDARSDRQWHGLMTSVAAAGRGTLSHGLYRGIASEASLVLVQASGPDGSIPDAHIVRALRFLAAYAAELEIQVVNLSVHGDAEAEPEGPVDAAVASLVEAGITVVAAAGNDGVRRLLPPATAELALTVGGLDDRNAIDASERQIWHSNYGATPAGTGKPEVVAPSLWLAAPVLPGSGVAREAMSLFARRRAALLDGDGGRRDPATEARLRELKLITPHYQHVEGTSFAAPIVASVVACMLEARPELRPAAIRELLIASATPIAGAPAERQGAGAVDAGRAVAAARRAAARGA